MNEFIFWPVGQGLFYSGNIDGYRFVYDCGATSTQKSLKGACAKKTNEKALFNSIARYCTYSDNSSIDFLAISHLHADHMNGVYELRKSCRIKRILLPYFQPIIYNSLVFEAYLICKGLTETK